MKRLLLLLSVCLLAASAVPAANAADSMKSMVLVDQDYTHVAGVTGYDWLKAIKAKKLTGQVSNAYLELTITRMPGNVKGGGAVSMYVAPLDAKGQIIPSKEWRRTRYVSAQWVGNCKRNIDYKNSFGVVRGPSSSTKVSLSAVSVTSDDLCSTERVLYDVEEMLNDDGVVLGFLPSGYEYHVKAVLRYSGQVTPSAF